MSQDTNHPDQNPCTDLLDRRETKTKTKKPSMWHVVFLNDDFTPMDFVAAVLQMVFHKSDLEASVIMLEVHLRGKGIAGTYTLEVAEMKVMETMGIARKAEHPLKVIAEKAE